MWSFRKEIHKISLKDPVIQISCTDLVPVFGNEGVYIIDVDLGTDVGLVVLDYEAFSIPDRFLIQWDGNFVADSKYVGDTLAASTSALLSTTFTNIPEYEIINGSPVLTGNDYTFVVPLDAIADGSSAEPTSGLGSISFIKSSATPSIARIVVYAPLGGTAFEVTPNCPVVPSTIEIQLGRSDKAQVACEEGYLNTSPYYILANQTFASCGQIFTDAAGTIPPTSDWYSDGIISRFWNGGQFTNTIEEACTTEPAVVGFDVASSVTACSNFINSPSIVHIPIGETFATATALLISSGSGNAAPAGIYSDGTVWREVDGGGTFINSGNC